MALSASQGPGPCSASTLVKALVRNATHQLFVLQETHLGSIFCVSLVPQVWPGTTLAHFVRDNQEHCWVDGSKGGREDGRGVS